MGEAKAGLILVGQDVPLEKFRILEFRVDADGAGSAGERKAKVSITTEIADRDDSSGDIWNMRETIELSPDPGERFYALRIVIEGAFRAKADSMSDDDVMRALTTDGGMDLYSIAKGYVASVTADGPYGRLILPSVKIVEE